MNDQLLEYVRKQFPALKREVNGFPAAYLDGPGGYQVPESVIVAVKHYLVDMNANVGDAANAILIPEQPPLDSTCYRSDNANVQPHYHFQLPKYKHHIKAHLN